MKQTTLLFTSRKGSALLAAALTFIAVFTAYWNRGIHRIPEEKSRIRRYPQAQSKLGEMCGDVRKAAEAGDAQVQFVFGFMFDKGIGVSENDIEAAKWIRKAAEQGLAQAQNILSSMYSEGVGTIYKENIKAAKWIRKAAEQGLPVALYNLGMMYYNGEGVEEDEVEAYAWFLLAKARGYYKGADRIIETCEESWIIRPDGQARAAELDRKIPKQ